MFGRVQRKLSQEPDRPERIVKEREPDRQPEKIPVPRGGNHKKIETVTDSVLQPLSGMKMEEASQ